MIAPRPPGDRPHLDEPDRVQAIPRSRSRLVATAAAFIRQAGALVSMSASGQLPAGVDLQQWRDAVRPDVQVLWLAHDATRDDLVQPLPPIESVIADGLLMAHVAVRMSIKNRILVAALRDRAEFDRAAFEDFARTELLRMAEENHRTATRLEPIVTALPPATRRSLAEQVELDAQRRRPAVHHALAIALAAASTEPDLIASMVQQAGVDAAEEYGQAVAQQLIRKDSGPAGRLDDRRAARGRKLVREDLKALAQATRATPRKPLGKWVSTRH